MKKLDDNDNENSDEKDKYDKKYEIEHMFIDLRAWCLSEKLQKMRLVPAEKKHKSHFQFDDYYLATHISNLKDYQFFKQETV